LGGIFSFASTINNKGQVVGNSSTSSGTSHAFVLSDGNITDLGTLNNQKFSNATSINNRGQIVGYSANDDSASQCVLWEDLKIKATFGGEYSHCFPYAINNAGQVVGSGSSDQGVTRAFLWEKGKDKSQDLGTLGGKSTYARGINNTGKVVGTSDSYSGKPRAFLWVKGKLFDLNNFLPKNSGWELTGASAMNNKGQIVGTGTFNGQPRAFLLTPVRVISP
jgi:probable HAF family extracellular repeat protein